ncbi:MAG: aldehyde:ferredoxin oxidoreductase [Deltaproteobacteria bacterium]|jgi:aldehyde:ferredoxin oxidoreductase|nr:aldehyde:ferredoxin oxidoreductase [Deltaproteobacteria bacterium]
MNGYAGKILRVDLSVRKATQIPTSKYEQWGGGHGMGSAIFFDLVEDKTIDGFDPKNVITIMTSPLTGTLVPGASGRTEMQGIGVQSYPIGWFTRSNFGGRFAAMLKFAGWDGIVIEGRADRPVWLDIRNDRIVIRDAGSLWGLDTQETQEAIWDEVMRGQEPGEWMDFDAGTTTQRPAVLTIGPAGENLSRLACLIHDASNAAGQGGFGAVWGSKNLKAVSVIGTGAFKVHDPKALMAARLWQKNNYAFDLDNLKKTWVGFGEFHGPPVPVSIYRGGRPKVDQRPQACVGCHSACRARYKDALGNEASCYSTVFYWDARTLEIQRKASDLINRYGLNAVEMIFGLLYIKLLNQFGLLGTGRIPECPLDFGKYGSEAFVERFVKMIAYGDDGSGKESQFGKDVSAGFVRAAEKWGRREEDLNNGMLQFPYWGIPIHKEPRAQVYWGYGTLLGDRDINEHDLDWLKWDVQNAKTWGKIYGIQPMLEAKEVVKVITDKMVPYHGDLHMLDFSAANIYSEHMAKLVAWHRYYTRFWKQSMLFCDVRWPDFVNLYAPGKIGSTGVAEPKYLQAVTGKEFSFLDGINLGRKIWNLDHAIWTLQGRHRDMVHFADIIYKKKADWDVDGKPYMPGFENGKWDYHNYGQRTLDRDKFDEFKTRFYQLQGWDTTSGYPTRDTLQSLDLGYVADELERNGKLGKA